MNFLKVFIGACLLTSFIFKPLLMKSFYDTENELEICEENDREGKETETNIDLNSFFFILDSKLEINYSDLSFLKDCMFYNLFYINKYNPKVISPPPKIM